MEQTINKGQIIENEKTLLNAFQNKDIVTLERLLHNDAFFILPNAQLLTKSTLLDNYRSGSMAMNSITSSDQVIQLMDDVAIVSMILDLQGNYNEQLISRRFRYIRVWKIFNKVWKVIATSGVQI